MQLTTTRSPRAASIFAVVITALAFQRSAHATPGTIVVVGKAAEHDRTVVAAAVDIAVHSASWEVLSAPFAAGEVTKIVACLRADRPWSCIVPMARPKGVERLVVLQVDPESLPGGGTQLVLVGELVIAGNGVPSIEQRYCPRCDDTTLSQLASDLTQQLLQSSASREGHTLLDIRSEPRDASVTIDGQMVGASNQQYNTHPGQHTVLIQRTGFQPYVSKVTIAEGEVVVIDAKMIVDGGAGNGDGHPHLVPGILIGAGAIAAAGGLWVSWDAKASPSGQQNQYTYSGPGIGVAVAGGVAIGVGVWLLLRHSSPASSSAPTVSFVPGGGVAGWSTSF